MNKIDMGIYLSFDDVLIKPKLGVVNSRADVDTSVNLFGFELKVPLISAPMQTVTEAAMANAMSDAGGLGVMHRFGPQPTWKMAAFIRSRPIAVATGLDLTYTPVVAADIIFLDVAHAHSIKVLRWVRDFKLQYPTVPLIAGSVATYEGAMALLEAGANGVRVGIGPGHACSTRIQTGAGVPQLSAIMEVARVRDFGFDDAVIIADGGIRNSGDIVKALSAGADCVMIGRLFAGASEAPRPGEYFGQASDKSQAYKGEYIEGTSGEVELTGPVYLTINRLMEGVRSGISYAGADSIRSLQERAEFIYAPSSLSESLPKVGV
jgi:IMP dehydrogenase